MEDVLAAQAHLVHQLAIIHARRPRIIIHNRVEDLAQDHDLLARDVELLKRLAADDLRLAVGVGVGGVPGVDAGVVGGLDDLEGVLLAKGPGGGLPGWGSEGHAAEDDL